MRFFQGALLACFLASAAAQQPVPTFGITLVIPSGLEGRIYHLRRDTPRLPDFQKLKPKGAIYTTSLNIPSQAFNQGFPGVTKRFEWFAIDYAGKFWIRNPGGYRFLLTSDDGAKLYIDDRVVIDNDGLHGPQDRYGDADLAEGVHRIRVSYFQGPRMQVALMLQIAPPGQSLRVFDTNEFKPPPSQVEDK